MTLVLIVLVVWVGLYLLMAAGTIFLQGYLNESPPTVKEVLIRAGGASSLIALFMAFWIWRAAANPDRFAALTDFSSRKQTDHELITVVFGQTRTELQRRNDARGLPEYRERVPPPRQGRSLGRNELPDEIIVKEEDGQEVSFKPERTSDNKLKRDPYSGRVVYRDARGREMEEGFLGTVTERRTGWTIGYWILNLVHFGVWLAAAWPIMAFRFGQGLVISLVAWITSTIFVMPPLLGQARKVHERRAVNTVSAVEGEKQNRRENRLVLPPISGVRLIAPPGSVSDRARIRQQSSQDYFEATEAAGKSILTLTS